MKLLIILSLTVLQALADEEYDGIGFEESYRQIRKEDLKKYVKVFEEQVEAIPDIELNQCEYFKFGKAISEKHREFARFCILYINLKGIVEGKPPKGLAWPVKGQEKHNLDVDGAWALADMYSMGLLKTLPSEDKEKEEKYQKIL